MCVDMGRGGSQFRERGVHEKRGSQGVQKRGVHVNPVNPPPPHPPWLRARLTTMEISLYTFNAIFGVVYMCI